MTIRCSSRTPARSRVTVTAMRVCLASPLLPALGLLVAAPGCNLRPELRAPPPEVTDDLEAPAPLPPSHLAVPVMFDLASVMEALEREVPRSFGDIRERVPHPTNGRMHVAFEAERSEFDWELVDESARLSATLRYRGRGWYDLPLAPEVSASCGTASDRDDRPAATLTLNSPLTLGADWRIRSRARVERIEPAAPAASNQCTVTVFGIDVTERVLNAARGFLDSNSGRIDREVARIDLVARLQSVWDRLSDPHELTDDVWLEVRPLRVAFGGFRGEGTRVRIHLGLTASPRIVLGPEPKREHTPLPPLELGGVGEGLNILVQGRAHYEEAAALLARELKDTELRWAGQRFRIREISLEGIGGGQVALGIGFGGSARGHVFLVGTPEIDAVTGEIHVPDLELDVASESLLMRSAAWIAQGELVRILRARARIPVAHVMEMATEQLDRGLNRRLSDEARLEGEVLTTELLGVRATRQALEVQAAATARATLHVGEPEDEDELPGG